MLNPSGNQRPQSQSIHYIVFFILTSVLFWVSPLLADQSYQKSLEEAKRFFYEGELDRALGKLHGLQNKEKPEVDYLLALIHRQEGIHQDFNLAFMLLEQSSAKGYSPAMRELGMAYERGEGITANLLVALDWYRKADTQEKPSTSIQFFKSNDGALVEQTIDQQIQHLKNAAADGDQSAAYQLAKLYDSGALVTQNLERAFHWYRVAAEAGHDYSCLMMGYFLCRGIGTKEDISEANHWLKLSGRKAICSGE
jgi:TPR repeat protein